MEKYLFSIFLLFFSGIVKSEISSTPLDHNENETVYFVSFSIPEKQLVTLIQSAEKLNIPVYIRGLVNNDMRATTKAILYLAQKYNIQGVLIDPLRFDYYQINSVPALVKKCGDKFDVVFGNVNLEQSLNLIKSQGDCK